MNVKEFDVDQISDYIHQERAKGREMDDIVRELVENRDDVILFSNDDAVAEQQVKEMAERLRKKGSGTNS